MLQKITAHCVRGQRRSTTRTEYPYARIQLPQEPINSETSSKCLAALQRRNSIRGTLIWPRLKTFQQLEHAAVFISIETKVSSKKRCVQSTPVHSGTTITQHTGCNYNPSENKENSISLTRLGTLVVRGTRKHCMFQESGHKDRWNNCYRRETHPGTEIRKIR